MRVITFSVRTVKEILRDPLNLAFGLGFPLVVLFLLTAIQANVPVELFELSRLTPGITVFGLAFMSLFSALLVSRDRESAFLQRLYTTPMRAVDFILGYILPMLPIALAQSAVCYLAAFCLGLSWTANTLLALLFLLPIALLFIGVGLLFGSLLSVKAASGICGALLTNLTALLSGIWFEVELVGGFFSALANALPFRHAVELSRAVFSGNFAEIFPHLWWVAGYAVGVTVLAIRLFLRQMKKR